MPAVLIGMVLGGFSRVMIRMLIMPMRHVSVMAGLLVVAAFVMLGSFFMVFRCVLVMFRRFSVVICAFVGHLGLPFNDRMRRTWITPATEYTSNAGVLSNISLVQYRMSLKGSPFPIQNEPEGFPVEP